MALLVMARIQTKKALLPMGPAIIGATFAVPLLFLGYAA